MRLRWLVAQYLEQRWWSWHLHGKEMDRYLEAKRAYWNRVLAEAGLKALRDKAVLDAGCGPAGIFLALPSCRVTALDPLVRVYSQRLGLLERERYPWVQFRDQALETLTEEEAFDVACCMNAINHVQNLALCLKNLERALRPGGLLVLTVDVHRSGFLKSVFQRLPVDILHPHQWTIQEYSRLLEGVGFCALHNQVLKRGRIFDHILFSAKKPS